MRYQPANRCKACNVMRLDTVSCNLQVSCRKAAALVLYIDVQYLVLNGYYSKTLAHPFPGSTVVNPGALVNIGK